MSNIFFTTVLKSDYAIHIKYHFYDETQKKYLRQVLNKKKENENSPWPRFEIKGQIHRLVQFCLKIYSSFFIDKNVLDGQDWNKYKPWKKILVLLCLVCFFLPLRKPLFKTSSVYNQRYFILLSTQLWPENVRFPRTYAREKKVILETMQDYSRTNSSIWMCWLVAFIGEVILADTEILAPLIGGFQVFLFEQKFHQLTLHAPPRQK